MKAYKSYLSLVLIAVVYLVSVYQYKPYRAFYLQIEGDAWGYYVYLPSFFIHHDLHDLHTTMDAKHTHHTWVRKASGNYQNKYFAGTAVLQAPFFLAAHFMAGFFHQSRDGFSMIYMYAVILSNLFYGLMSLFIISVILRRRFSDIVTAVVLLVLGLGTNLYYLEVMQAPFSHVYLLFWYALLIYFTVRFYDTMLSRFILLSALAYGMIILTRPNEVYAIVIPLLWGIGSMKELAGRVLLFRKYVVSISAAVLIIFLCVVPQMLYWKVSTGHFLIYSYGDEKFDFLHPHIWDGLFSAMNGWLMYSPVMILALIGIWYVYRRSDESFAPLMVFLPLHIYVIYSWWCWYYMGSYGSRPMVESYALLSIPLAYTVEAMHRSLAKKMVSSTLLLFCIWLVIFQTYQSSLGIFMSEISNWRYNLLIFGKTKVSYDEAVVLDTREVQPSAPGLVKALCTIDYEDTTLAGSTTAICTSGRRSQCVKARQYSNGYAMKLRDTGARPGQWIRAGINCYSFKKPLSLWEPALLVIDFEMPGRENKWKSVRMQNRIDNPDHLISRFTKNAWGNVYFFSQIPGDMQPDDEIKVYVSNANQSAPDVYIDDLKVELYDGNKQQ